MASNRDLLLNDLLLQSSAFENDTHNFHKKHNACISPEVIEFIQNFLPANYSDSVQHYTKNLTCKSEGDNSTDGRTHLHLRVRTG